MTEREERQTEDLLANKDINDLKSDTERKQLCVELVRNLFGDNEILHIALDINDWQTLLPEVAKGLSHFKSSELVTIKILGPNLMENEIDWFKTDENDADGDNGDQEELESPPPYCEIDFYFDDGFETDEDYNGYLSLFLDDRHLELWTYAEEKEGIYVERRSNKRKGNTQRLKMFAEVISLAKDRLG